MLVEVAETSGLDEPYGTVPQLIRVVCLRLARAELPRWRAEREAALRETDEP